MSLLPAYAAALAVRLSLRLDSVRADPDAARRHADIRSIGSGNIGATNVLRTGRKGLAAATLLGDALKGTLAVLLVYWYFGPEFRYFARDLAIPAALGAFLGHLFPVWLGFKGGKGVATYIGLLLALAWPAAVVFCVVWLAVAAVTPLLVACRADRERGNAVPAVWRSDNRRSRCCSRCSRRCCGSCTAPTSRG